MSWQRLVEAARNPLLARAIVCCHHPVRWPGGAAWETEMCPTCAALVALRSAAVAFAATGARRDHDGDTGTHAVRDGRQPCAGGETRETAAGEDPRQAAFAFGGGR